MNVSHPQQTEGTDHQDADPRPEVPAVDRYNEHDGRRERPQRCRQSTVSPTVPAAGEPRLEHEQDRPAEHQPRHEEQEVPVARPDEQQRPHQPAESTGDEEQPQPKPGNRTQFAAGTPYGTRVGGKEGESAGCVGDHGRDDQGQQRESDQPAAARKRVDQAGRNRCHEEQYVSYQTTLTPLPLANATMISSGEVRRIPRMLILGSRRGVPCGNDLAAERVYRPDPLISRHQATGFRHQNLAPVRCNLLRERPSTRVLLLPLLLLLSSPHSSFPRERECTGVNTTILQPQAPWRITYE